MSVSPQPVTLDEFLAWETRQPGKYEYRAGAVLAMAGATDDHNGIVANLLTLIRPVLRGGPGRIYANDMKLVTGYPGSRYPDVLVTCDPRDAIDRLIKRYPKLIVEILSNGTAEQDATDKLDEYQTIAELEEYLLVDSRKRSVRLYARRGSKMETGPAIISGAVTLQSLDLTLSLDEIYEDVSFATA